MTTNITSTTGTPMPPALQLDKRQRAMLKDMGVRVWSPLPDAVRPAAASAAMPEVAPEIIAAQAANTRASALKGTKNSPVGVSKAPPAAPTASTAAVEPANAAVVTRTNNSTSNSTFTWQFGAPHALYADAPPGPGGPRWLVLAETDAAAVQRSDFHPFDGEAGTLLANMLRAARLNAPGRVVLVPLCRQAASQDGPAALTAPGVPDAPDASAALAALTATHSPQLLLIMGRLAAQALLHSTEPLGKLRGRIHTLHGVPTVVTYDAQPLLRTPADKAKAWDDLCLGISAAAS